MLKQPITFDRFIRGCLVLALLVGLGLLIDRLSRVLLPFFVAWLLAYLMYPLVHFLEVRCHLRWRILSITIAVLLILGVLTGLLFLIVPPIETEMAKVVRLASTYSDQLLGTSGILNPYVQQVADQIATFRNKYQQTLMDLVQKQSFVQAIETILAQLWAFLRQTVDFAVGLVGSLIVLLYLFFILMDYEKLSEGWVRLVPPASRDFVSGLMTDLKNGMNAYFRGQALVALCVGILFSIGFLIVGFPMAIGLGLFMGLLNLVPYLQTLGFVPMAILALLESADTGESFWLIVLPAVIVVAVVQVVQDMFLVPKIMGHEMGLNPAVILLSLSVWGSLLGFIGLIIALPLTTILFSYYRRFVLHND